MNLFHGNKMKSACLILVFLAMVMVTPGYGAFWFAGVGNDGYIRDVNGIYSALSSSPGLGELQSNRLIRENQNGSAIVETITGLSNLINPGDTLFWAYSGHGAHTADADNDESHPSGFAMNTRDETLGLYTDPDQVLDDDLAQAFSGLAGNGTTIITLFDACHSGGLIGGSQDLNSVPGLTFMGSSMETELSYAYTGEPYSIFTQALVSGLVNLGADENKDNILSAREWFDFAFQHTVGDVSGQHPVFWGDEDLVIVNASQVPLPGSFLLLGLSFMVLIKIRP